MLRYKCIVSGQEKSFNSTICKTSKWGLIQGRKELTVFYGFGFDSQISQTIGKKRQTAYSMARERIRYEAKLFLWKIGAFTQF